MVYISLLGKHMNNESIAEYAKIKTDLLSSLVTGMLSINALGVTVTVGLLDRESSQEERTAIMILVFAAATAVALFFLAHHYFETVSQRISVVERAEVEEVADAAKKFFVPFIVCLVANILVALGGAIFLTIAVVGNVSS
jgi:hypothetical protein